MDLGNERPLANPVLPWYRAVVVRTGALSAHAYQTGLPHLILSFISVQGLAYVAQIVLARLLPPAEFGVVRSVEAVLQVLILVGSAGMPSLAVRAIAELDGSAIRTRVLARLALLATACAGIAGGAGWFLAPVLFRGQAQLYLMGLVWVVLLTAPARTLLNYFQGADQIRRLSAASVTLSGVSFLAVVGAVLAAGMRGWMVGRYAGEAMFLVGSIALVVRHTHAAGGSSAGIPPKYSYGRLLVDGFAVSSTLVLRMLQDNTGLVTAAALGVSDEAQGHYGLAYLGLVAAVIIPGGVCGLALPYSPYGCNGHVRRLGICTTG